MARRSPLLLLLVAAELAISLPRPAMAAARTGAVVIHYDVQGRGNTVDIEGFAGAATETYADPQGWARGETMRFERVASDGDFTLWLAADADMASFGGACGPVWSCRSGRNVVVNESRWREASPAWNEAGGALRDYRHMVVNHETGHWLGLGHQTCTTAGSPAAVMQQQSMGLQGCTFNPWPQPAEHRRVEAGTRLQTLENPPAPSVRHGFVAPASPRRVPAFAARCAYVAWRTTRVACR